MRIALLALTSLVVVTLPVDAPGQERANTLSGGLGYYFYAGDVEDRTSLDGAVNVELAYTRDLHRHFALRAGVGYFHDGRRGDDFRGYPVTVTALLVYPRDRLRLFAGGGLGVYFVDYDGRIDGLPVDDTDTVWGGHLLAGASYQVWGPLLVGLEAKYLLLDSPSLGARSLDMDGVTLTATVGVRF